MRLIPSVLPPTSLANNASDIAHLRGTESRLLSQMVRFAMSTRTLGPRRVAKKFFRRARVHWENPRHADGAPGKLDTLHRCSWLSQLPELKFKDCQITSKDLAEFQATLRYPRYYYHGERRIRYSLWHYLGTRLAELNRASVILDVGAQAGLWGTMIRRRFGCQVFDLDLEYKPGLHGFRIGASAGQIPLPDRSLTHIVSFCAFNCFEGNDDSALIDEATRLLMPGGRLILVPLCIGDEFVNLYDPDMINCVDRLDAGARPAPLHGWGNRFGRWYDKAAFTERILRHAQDLDIEIHQVRHSLDPTEQFEAMYAARMTYRL